MGDLDDDGATATLDVSFSAHSQWQRMGALSRSQRVFGVSANMRGSYFRMRIRNTRGEEQVRMVDGAPRAVFEDFGLKSEQLQSEHQRIVKKKGSEFYSTTVLCGAGEALSGALCDRFRIRFRTNNVRTSFGVGFVFGDTDTVSLDAVKSLGDETNRKHSVWICVVCDCFLLYDQEGHRGRECPSSLPSGTAFPVCGQQWLIEFDFAARLFSLFLRMQKQWKRALKRELVHSHIVPAFTLDDEDDEIEIL